MSAPAQAPIYVKITPMKKGQILDKSKFMMVDQTEKGLVPRDPNGNGYYHVPYTGKVSLVQLFTEDHTSKSFKTEHSDMDIIAMDDKPQEATCVLVLRGKNGGIVYALHEILSGTERAIQKGKAADAERSRKFRDELNEYRL